MYTTVFSDFVLATQEISSALSSLAKGTFQRDKKADPVGACCVGWRERGTGARKTLSPGPRHLSVVSMSNEVSGCKEQGRKYDRAIDELSMHPCLC